MNSLTVNVPKITILDQVINMVDGLYSLNDFHRASGGDKKHQPAFFMRNQEVNDLIEEIKCSANLQNKQVFIKLVSGKNRGTYVCKELVYRYAMWISPKFALLVIRTFDKLVTGELQVKPTGLSTVSDRRPLAEAVNIYCAKTGSIHSDVWKLVHQRFGLEGVHELTVDQVPQAVEYVHSLLLQAQSGSLDLNVAMNNEMWRYVGILKHMELGKALRDAKSAMDNLYKAIGGAQHHSSLIYDAFGEQQMPVSLGDKGGHTAYEKAKAFIARQDEQKKQWLLR